MKLKLFVDIFNRKLVTSATSDMPVELPVIYREDYIDLEVMLLEPTGSLSDPLSTVDISNLSLQLAIGNPDVDPEALQTTFTKNTTTNVFSGSININTTEMVAAFTAATGNTISRSLEIEVEGTASQYHTVLQQSVTLSKDIITHPLVAPVDVTTGTAFANSFATTATDSTTVEWTASGDSNYAHIKGMSAASSLTAGKFIKVNSAGTGFEETDATTTSSAIDDLTDVDTTTAAPSTGDLLKWDGTNWIPTTLSVDNLSDADTSTASPTTGQILSWDGSNWVPAAGASAGSQNLWATVTADSGTTTADSVTDSLKIEGGAGMNTVVVNDVVTLAGEDASYTNKGIASFDPLGFSVSSGHVQLISNPISTGGTSATSAEDAFDNLAPTTTAGDLITHDGSNNIRLPIGTAHKCLKVNTAANAVEWADVHGHEALPYTLTADPLGVPSMECEINMNGAPYQSLVDIDGVTEFSINEFRAGYPISLRLRAVMEDEVDNDDQLVFPLMWPMDWVWLSAVPSGIQVGHTMVVCITCYGNTNLDVVAGAAPVFYGEPYFSTQQTISTLQTPANVP
jgi:hypothetical protein